MSAFREPRVLMPAMEHPSASKEEAGGQQKPIVGGWMVELGNKAERTGNEGASAPQQQQTQRRQWREEEESVAGSKDHGSSNGKAGDEQQRRLLTCTFSKKSDLFSVLEGSILRRFCTKLCAELKCDFVPVGSVCLCWFP